MLLLGISDTLAGATGRACPECGGAAQIDGGTCVSCLLRKALDSSSRTELREPGVLREDSRTGEHPPSRGYGVAGEQEHPPSPSCGVAGEHEQEYEHEWLDLLDSIDIRDADWKLGNYQILDEIGRGGMGVIYRARQRHSRRIVALKRVLSYHSESRETLERFRREAEAAASLDHPNILPIYDVGEADDLPFFTMKLATGGSLQQVAPALRQNPRECVRLLMKITRAVAYAHGEGILHRDLKPGNILLDARGEPLVSDFGLAKWLDGTSDLTRTLTIFGTPGYIAPEQAHSSANDLTPAADIYSLGAILFDLLTGRPPFLGEHALAVIKQADERPAPKLRSVIKTADRDLQTICAKCLEREPSARYHSAADLAEDLQRWLEGRPIKARRVSPPVQVWRWTKRNPVLASSIVACAALGTATAAFDLQRRANARLTAAALHSISVKPFLDLDSARYDLSSSGSVAAGVERDFAKRGPARVSVSHEVAVNDNRSRKRGPFGDARVFLTGTQRVHKGKLRMSVRLVNAADSKVLYKRVVELNRSVAAQTDAGNAIGRDVYSILGNGNLTAAEIADEDSASRDPTARESLVSGRAVEDRHTLLDIDRAIQLFQRAVDAQSSSALAQSCLSEAHWARWVFTGNARSLVAAEQCAGRALQLNADSSEAHKANSMVLFEQGRFTRSLEEALTALELADHTDDYRLINRITSNLRMLGEPRRAIPWYELTLKNSDRPYDSASLGDCYTELADDNRAAAAYNRTLTLFPEHPEGWMGLCRVALLRKDFNTARRIASDNWQRYRDFSFSQQMAAEVAFFSRDFAQAAKLYEELAAKDPDGGSSVHAAISYASALAKIYQDAQRNDAANRLLQAELGKELARLQSSPEHPVILYRVAAIESCLGMLEPSLKHLDAAVKNGWIDYRSLDLDPRFDSVRSQPSFTQLIADLKSKVDRMRDQQTTSTSTEQQPYD
ncbi:MAG: protein kinase [Verrucomicrobia bacterium]|nr:protein kinase [Verrucomicrobiota bacterium]